MKKCPACSRTYPDHFHVCARDKSPLQAVPPPKGVGKKLSDLVKKLFMRPEHH